MPRAVPSAYLSTLIICVIVPSVRAQTPNFMPRQVLLRFADGSPQRALVTEVSRTVPLDLGGLTNITEELGTRAGLPLRTVQLGSGDWMTVEIVRSTMAERLEAGLAESAGVRDVTSGGAEQDGDIRLMVTLQSGSEPYEAIRNHERDPDAANEVFADWSTATGVVLHCAVQDDGTVSVEVDWRATTLALVDRLDHMPEIEAAQPNFSQM